MLAITNNGDHRRPGLHHPEVTHRWLASDDGYADETLTRPVISMGRRWWMCCSARQTP